MRKDRSTSIEISENDKKHELYLNILDGIHSSILPGYDIKKILYNEAWFCLEMDKRKVWDAILHYIVFPPYRLDTNIANYDVVTFYVKNYRNDHDGYWKRILKDLGKHDEITVLSEKNRKEKLKILSVVGVFKRLSWFIRFLIELSPISCKKDKYHLAIQLMLNKEILQQIERMDLHPKIAMCFFDSAPYTNLIMQFFKRIGAVTITNQHGQPLFRSWDYDHLNQSQILNFTSDYFLAKGYFTKKQFINAGRNADRVKVVGDMMKKDPSSWSFNKKMVFGVFLDTPSYTFAKRTNIELLKIADEIADDLGYRYIVKLHPTDFLKNYSGLTLRYCIDRFDEGAVLSDLFSMIDFGIMHASSIYVDMISNGLRAFKMKTDIYYPIVDDPRDVFEDLDDIKGKIKDWDDMADENKKGYLMDEKKRYLFDSLSGDEIERFILSLIKN